MLTEWKMAIAVLWRIRVPAIIDIVLLDYSSPMPRKVIKSLNRQWWWWWAMISPTTLAGSVITVLLLLESAMSEKHVHPVRHTFTMRIWLNVWPNSCHITLMSIVITLYKMSLFGDEIPFSSLLEPYELLLSLAAMIICNFSIAMRKILSSLETFSSFFRGKFHQELILLLGLAFSSIDDYYSLNTCRAWSRRGVVLLLHTFGWPWTDTRDHHSGSKEKFVDCINLW